MASSAPSSSQAPPAQAPVAPAPAPGRAAQSSRTAICPECQDSFAERALTRHRATRHGVNRRTFTCDICNMEFPRNDALRDHRANSHGVHNPTTAEQDEVDPIKVGRYNKTVLANGIIEASDGLNTIKQDCLALGARVADFPDIMVRHGGDSFGDLMALKKHELVQMLLDLRILRRTWRENQRGLEQN